jgi:predicted HTH transcriptional regulator
MRYTRSKQITQILESLNERTRAGTWVAKSRPELVSAIWSTTGQNSINCSIRAFRVSAADISNCILELLRDGAKLRSSNIASELGRSFKTVKRELDSLLLAGRIEFTGPNKTGTYQLVDGSDCRNLPYRV